MDANHIFGIIILIPVVAAFVRAYRIENK